MILQPQLTQQHDPIVTDAADLLRAEVVRLGHEEYGRYGYRRITALLQREGWQVNHKHVDSI